MVGDRVRYVLCLTLNLMGARSGVVVDILAKGWQVLELLLISPEGLRRPF